MDLETVIRKFALKNAHDYGQADPKAVVGKVLAEFPDAKKDMKTTMAAVTTTLAEVNALSKEQVASQLQDYEFKEKEEKPRLFSLPNAEKGKVVTRFLPEPNGYPHLGHAKAAFLSWEFARQWEGRCLLRFDDTNPEAEKLEYVQAIREDLAWLGLEFAGESYTSDKMPQLTQFAKKMIILGTAYICTCPAEEMNQNRYDKKACACRDRVGGENLGLFQRMVAGGAKKGEMVLRLRGDMQSDNTVMRDPTLFRVLDAPHYRQGEKYKAWPTYDFEVSIADALEDVTHALRSKEYELRDELYYKILESVNLKKPLVYDFARLKIKGTALSKRLIRPLIEQGKVKGYDDPRLATLRALRRRGILPQAIREFVLSMGLSKQESSPSFEQLLQINRRHLDPFAEHYFFVEEPIKVTVKGLKPQTLKLPRKGQSKQVREIRVEDAVFISNNDADALTPGDAVRLKELAVVKITGTQGGELHAELLQKLPPDTKIIQWVSAAQGQHAPCTVVQVGDLLDEKEQFNEYSLTERKGVCEKDCLNLVEGQSIQFERVGFCRLDANKIDGLSFILSA